MMDSQWAKGIEARLQEIEEELGMRSSSKPPLEAAADSLAMAEQLSSREHFDSKKQWVSIEIDATERVISRLVKDADALAESARKARRSLGKLRKEIERGI